ncbi:MAG: rRNA maturation RNase YbeY [Proteobacteria bacterium]|jgi:probable rRNA maturation factor|nr:rRNA maturation RNase YbeY [Pseudomonadota bacterium]
MTTAGLAQVGSAPLAEVDLALQVESVAAGVPDQAFFAECVARAAAAFRARVEVTLRVVDEDEGRALNRQWRERDYATNVLSFAAEGLADIAPDLLGDIVLCAPVVSAEARAQGKQASHHWAHLTVHGVLHLLGFDHQDDEGATLMEQHERAILAAMGIADPYRA